MKRIFAKGLILALFAGLTACNDDEPAPYGVGEVYVISKLEAPAVEGDDPTVVYALHMEAAGQNQVPTSVVVTGPGSTTHTLTGSNGFFMKETAFTTTVPAEGTYTFTYTFPSGEVDSSLDALSDEVLEPANIKTVSVLTDKINLEWDEVEGADVIEVVLRDSEAKMIFSSTTNMYGYLNGDKTEYTLGTTAGSWGAAPVDGGTYTLEVRGLLAGAASYYQSVSIASVEVVWGSGE